MYYEPEDFSVTHTFRQRPDTFTAVCDNAYADQQSSKGTWTITDSEGLTFTLSNREFWRRFEMAPSEPQTEIDTSVFEALQTVFKHFTPRHNYDQLIG